MNARKRHPMTLPFTDDELRAALYAAFRDMGFTDTNSPVTEEQAAEAERRALATLTLASRAKRHPHHCHWPGCKAEVPPRL